MKLFVGNHVGFLKSLDSRYAFCVPFFLVWAPEYNGGQMILITPLTSHLPPVSEFSHGSELQPLVSPEPGPASLLRSELSSVLQVSLVSHWLILIT